MLYKKIVFSNKKPHDIFSQNLLMMRHLGVPASLENGFILQGGLRSTLSPCL